MNSRASKEQVKLVRSLMLKLGMGRHRYLGSWCETFGLTVRERRGSIDMMDATVAAKLILGLQDEVEVAAARDAGTGSNTT
jgi:hypothetical protein